MAAWCRHLDQVRDVRPRTPEGCEECLRNGDGWVHLRLCLSCGHVGCCDESPGKHATKHFQHSGHPVMRFSARRRLGMVLYRRTHDRAGTDFALTRSFFGRDIVSDHDAALGRAFIKAQRERLEALRAHLSGSEEAIEATENAFEEEHGEETREFEEEGQRMARIEIERGLHAVSDRRLRAIDRALRKIEEGSYGLSDISGDPIPKARLEAAPEACLTIEEEEREEKQDGR